MFKESACQKIKSSAAYVIASFTMVLQKNKIKVSHTKINTFFHATKMLLQSQIITQ